MTAPVILNVYPTNGAIGIPIADQVKVYFNQEMDLSSINAGTFVLIGKDEAPIFGPIDVTPLDDPGFEDEDILSSPYAGAYVKGTIEFFKTDGSGAILSDDSILDEGGNGTLWNTLAVFTPDKPLSPNSKYQVVILGDENTDDDFDTGVTARTVFDTKSVSVSGDAGLTFYGGYTDDFAATYIVEITSGGPTGTAEYLWWREDASLDAYEGITTTGERELESGVYVTCSHDGNFVTGDKFSVAVRPAVPMANNYAWEFVVGSGSITTAPSTTSATGIESLVVSGAGELEIIRITPENQETNLDPDSVSVIRIEFNKDLNPDSITDETIKVWTEPVNGNLNDESVQYEGNIAKVLEVQGNILIIQIT